MSSDFDPTVQEVNHSSPGKMLRDAREKLALTQESVAKELFMTLTKVKAIENDDYQRLHSDTFIRGYLRAYGQLVQLDLPELLSIYDNQAKLLGLKDDFVPAVCESSNRRIWVFIGSLIAVLVLFWLLSVWFLGNSKKDEFANLELSMAAQKNISLNTGNLEISEVVSNTQSTENVAEVEPNTSALSDLEVVEESSSTKADRISFAFSDECWLEVSDAKGDVLVTALQLKDSKLELEGQAPFEVKLGNAPAASVKLNDEDVRLVPALGTNVLSIKLGGSSDQ